MFVPGSGGTMTKRTVTNNATFTSAGTATSAANVSYYNGHAYSDIIERQLFFNS